MKYRIAMWAGAGFFVAGFWAFYFFPTATPIISAHPIVWTLSRLTCPIFVCKPLLSFRPSCLLGVSCECCYICVRRPDRRDFEAATKSGHVIQPANYPGPESLDFALAFR
jgi:hypothetical protein